MNIFKIASNIIEGRKNTKSNTTTLAMQSDINDDVKEEVLDRFCNKVGTDAVDDEASPVKKAKLQKGDILSQRYRKMQCDIDAAVAMKVQLDAATELRHVADLKAGLENAATELKQKSREMHEASMEGKNEEVDTLWRSVVPVCKDLAEDINLGNKRLNINAKAYVTNWDSVLS